MRNITFWWKDLKVEGHLVDLGLDGKIIAIIV
jgi:hypothetical protein